MLALVAGRWRLPLLRGLMAMALAVLAQVWPNLSVDALVAIVGAYALINGAAAVAMGVRSRGVAGSRGLLWEGVTSIAAGVLVLRFREIAPSIISAWALMTGIAMVAAGVTLRDQLKAEPIPLLGALLLIGALSLVLGFVIAHPVAPEFTTVMWMVTVYGMLAGAAQLALAIRVRERAQELSGA